jgi:hypothetical protein
MILLQKKQKQIDNYDECFNILYADSKQIIDWFVPLLAAGEGRKVEVFDREVDEVGELASFVFGELESLEMDD